MTTEDRATLQTIVDKAYEQVSSVILADQLFDLDGRYMCLTRQHTRLTQVSQSQAGLLERIEEMAREAAGAKNDTQRQLAILDIIAAAHNGAVRLREAMAAPITIRRE